MKSQELYYKFKLLINKSGKATNIDVPKPVFVSLYNDEQERWLKQTIFQKKDSDDIDDIEGLTVYDEPAVYKDKTLNYFSYKLPPYFKLTRVKVEVESQSCKKFINATPVNYRNINDLLADVNSKPSLEWEETFYTVADNSVKVYVDDFSVKSVYLTYYKIPKKIDLSGYIDLEGKPSKDVDSDLKDVYQRQILDRVAKEINREVENPAGFQLATERLSTAEKENF